MHVPYILPFSRKTCFSLHCWDQKPKMIFLFKARFLLLLLFLHKTKASAALQQWHYSNSTSHRATKLQASSTRKCNIFRGKWVFDSSYPLYDFSTCPFIDNEFNCLKNKRPDKSYLKYRWQPSSCGIPRFNGVAFLEKMRGKKIMFVGDSLSLNMWQSLSCMVHAWVPKAKTIMIRKNGIADLTFVDYGVKLLLYRTPYIVDMVKEKAGIVLKLNSIQGGNAWRGMDVLVFNSWHWWTHLGSSQLWEYMQDGNKLVRDMNRLEAYYKAMTTWAQWVNRNVDPLKTKVFFQGISPIHYEGRDWGAPSKSCANEKIPFLGMKYPAGTPSPTLVLNKVLARMKKPVYFLDITQLSQYRKDAHPSYYSDKRSSLDCSHWCLPGLPDTWNQLLYASLLS